MNRAAFMRLFYAAIALATTALVSHVPCLAEEKPASSTRSDLAWKAGTARAIITPDKPVWLAGYGTKRVPDGKLHELWMKALALEDPNGHRAVLITSDFQGVPKGMSDPAFEELRKQFNLERKDVMLTFSH